MIVKEKFQAGRDYLHLAHKTALYYSIRVPAAAEDLAAEIWGEEFIRRFWEENPETAWAELFVDPGDLSVLLIVGDADLQTDGNFYVAVFESPIVVEQFGEDRLYIYYDKELPLHDAPEDTVYDIIELTGHDTGEWDILEWEYADATDRGMHRVIFGPAE